MTRDKKEILSVFFFVSFYLLLIVSFLSNFILTKNEKNWSINYLHDVIFGEQRVDAEARHTGYGDAHDAQ